MTTSDVKGAGDGFNNLGEAIRERRTRLTLSQIDLGLLAGLHRGTIRNAETGKQIGPATAAGIATSLGCIPEVTASGSMLRPVFSAATSRFVAQAVLAKSLNQEDLETVSNYWRDLVAELAHPSGTLPLGFEDFRSTLAEELPGSSLSVFDREISDLVEGATGEVLRMVGLRESAPGSPSIGEAVVTMAVDSGRITSSDAETILAARKDPAMTGFLVDFVARRRTEFEHQLATDIAALLNSPFK